MEFHVNHPILFILAGLAVLVVLAQSVFFLVKAWRHAKKIGMDMKKLKKIAISAAIFTIAPAVAIVVSVIALAKDLGIALPWLRLSVVGSLSYETIAAANAESAMGLKFGQVQDAINKLTAGRTTFAIAHRLSTLRNASRILVLDHGKIAEYGTHCELIDRKGIIDGNTKMREM